MEGVQHQSFSRRLPITPPKRNPITQEGVTTPKFNKPYKSPQKFEESPQKGQGIARALFSDHSRRSFSLAYSTPEPYIPSKRMNTPVPSEPVLYPTSKKRSEFTPTRRDPIMQDTIEVTPPKIRPKITESSITLMHRSRPVRRKFIKPEKGSYQDNMKSNIFSLTEEPMRSFLKRAPTKASEMAGIITYKDCPLKEDSQAVKPNYTKIIRKDLSQKNSLNGMAKIYCERELMSQVAL